MNFVFAFAAIATILSGVFTGIALQKSLVELPARKKTGALVFAQYARAADLGNGLYLYPSLAFASTLLTIGAFVLGLMSDAPSDVLIFLGLAGAFGIGVLGMTAFAAPQMLKIGKTADDEELLKPLLEKFATYSAPRAVFIALQFVFLFLAILVQ